MPVYANDYKFPIIKLDEYYCLFTMDKVRRHSIPEGLHSYEISRAEESAGTYLQVQKEVNDQNRLGNVLCKEEIPLDASGQYFPKTCSALATEMPYTARKFMKAEPKDLNEIDANGFLYNSLFGLIPVYPFLSMYCDNNNLYIGFDFYDEEEQAFESYGDVTVNVGKLPYLYSSIDTNNNGDKILDFLERNGFGQKTDFSIPSGFCRFPVFRFDPHILQKIDPKVFDEYAECHGQRLPKPGNLSDTIAVASEKAAVKNPSTHGIEPTSTR